MCSLAVACLLSGFSAEARIVPPPQASSDSQNIRRLFGLEHREELDREILRAGRVRQERFERHRRRYHVPHRYGSRTVRAHRVRVTLQGNTKTADVEGGGWPNFFGFSFYTPSSSGASGDRLLHVAERYVGKGNFTGFNGKWCAAAAGMWLREAGYTRLPSLAAVSYARYGKPSGPRVGAVAVLPHHIGVVAKVYSDSILLLSGNHRHNVGYSVVSNRAIVAFREPI
jgi:hypothetical protein